MLRVRPYCQYLTVQVPNPRKGIDGDLDATTFVKLVKDERERLKPGNYTQRPDLDGRGPFRRYLKFDNTEAGVLRARAYFGTWAATTIKQWRIDSPILYPIPNSHVTPDFQGEYTTLAIAEAIARAFGSAATVVASLRWREPKVPAHKGGPRDEKVFRDLLTYDRGGFAFDESDDAILIDDVLTYGRHMRAARDVLDAAGVAVTRGIVCGKRMKIQAHEPFNLPEEDLDEADLDDIDTA